MPAQFTLNWDNTAISGSGNVTGQTVSYRKKLVGGSFITTGFTPANNLAKTVNSATTPNTLSFNGIYEFQVVTLCTINGPTPNSNGIIEQISFACLTPTITFTDVTGRIVLNITGLDISRARFTLKKTSDNSIITGPININPVGSTITADATGLTSNTGYYWEHELYTTVNGVEVISSAVAYLNGVCTTSFTTLTTVSCPAPDTLVVTN